MDDGDEISRAATARAGWRGVVVGSALALTGIW